LIQEGMMALTWMRLRATMRRRTGQREKRRFQTWL
jgi:hypothetical protein